MKHILTGAQFADPKLLEDLFARIKELEEADILGKVPKLLNNKIVATMFYEPSTRTRLSFETAALKLGAGVISAENAATNSSAFKGETIEDTTRVLNSYADIIVMRHPQSGTALAASKVSTKPIINAGDGANEHPTQAMLDLYTIHKEHGGLSNLCVVFWGDLLNSRPLHSLMPILMMYSGNTFYFVSPKELKLPAEYTNWLRENKVVFEELDQVDTVLPKADILYVTRVQKERFANPVDYENVKGSFVLVPKHLETLNKTAIILHALPRVTEIDPRVDTDPRAAYFRQAQNGLYTRMALLVYSLEQ